MRWATGEDDGPAFSRGPVLTGGREEPSPELLEAWKDRVYCLALGLSRNPSEAADVSQEVFLKLLTRLPQFRAEARFSSWLYRIVVNAHLDRKRAARRLLSLDAVAPARRALPPPEREALRVESQRLVARAVAALPRKLRVPLVLRHVNGLSYEEIGAVLDLPAGTVASRLSRALRHLARALPAQADLEV